MRPVTVKKRKKRKKVEVWAQDRGSCVEFLHPLLVTCKFLTECHFSVTVGGWARRKHKYVNQRYEVGGVILKRSNSVECQYVAVFRGRAVQSHGLSCAQTGRQENMEGLRHAQLSGKNV